MDDDDDTEYESVHKYDQRTIRRDVEDKGTNTGEDYGRSVIFDYCAMIKDLMEEDVSDLFKIKAYKNTSVLVNHDVTSWVKQRPLELVQLLKTLCGLDESQESMYKLAQIIEAMYGSINKKLILPGSFRHNIVAYSFSHSRQLIDYINSIMPASSYSTLTGWLSNEAKKEITFPKEDVRVVFDNQQVIGKRYKVNAKSNTVPSSVITSQANLVLNTDVHLQWNEALKPKQWFFKEKTIDPNCLDEANDYFRKSRNRFIKSRWG